MFRIGKSKTEKQRQTMSDLVRFNENDVTASSRVVAEKFKKTHKHVLESISKLECSEEFRLANFRPSFYISPQNKKLRCFDITRDGFAFLAMGFKGKRAGEFKEKYINAFNEYEKNLKSNGLMDRANQMMAMLTNDKKIASVAGKALSDWRKVKSDYEIKISKLMSEAQIELGV